MKVKAINHIAIIVKDMGKAIHFYRDILGLKYVMDFLVSGPDTDKLLGLKGINAHIYLLKTENDYTLLELTMYKHPKGRMQFAKKEENDVGIRHICFEVDDIYEVYDVLFKKGVVFISEPIKMSVGKVCCFLKDPEGNSIELIQLMDKDDN
ncbi:unnamed protein product [marine sediment metagenome]|uniref:VOC domain-containing protein n=1 Tax=marine sediment metagenome TaxID=412755 RepID=X1UYP8_9ZZZZ